MVIMKKVLSVLILMVLMLSITTPPAYAASKEQTITMQEFNNLMKKYGLKAEALDKNSITKESIISGLSKDELENLIKDALKKTSQSVVVNKVVGTIEMPESMDSDSGILKGNQNSTANALTYTTNSFWQVANRSATLTASTTMNGMDIVVNASAGYQFEYFSLAGEPDPTRNWKFVSASAGAVTNTSNAYTIDSTQKSISFTDSVVKETVTLTYTYYLTLDVKGFPFRIPFSNGSGTSTFYWYISSYQY
jgi:hypothetical protein